MSEDLVFKSYVPGMGYVKATEVGAKELRGAFKTRKIEGSLNRMKTKNTADKFRAAQAGNASALKNHTTVRGKVGSTYIHTPDKAFEQSQAEKGADAGTVRFGSSKRGTSHVVAPVSTPDSTMRHEMFHAAPQRSSWRHHQIQNDPRKLAREEAWAHSAESGPVRSQRPADPRKLARKALADRAARLSAPKPAAAPKPVATPAPAAPRPPRASFAPPTSSAPKAGVNVPSRPTPQMPNSAPSTPQTPKPAPDPSRASMKPAPTNNTRRNVLIGGGATVGAGGGMYALHRKSVSKAFETLDMGGAMVTEEPKKDLPVRDLNTGRFVATPHLQKMSRAHDSLVWERSTDG